MKTTAQVVVEGVSALPWTGLKRILSKDRGCRFFVPQPLYSEATIVPVIDGWNSQKNE